MSPFALCSVLVLLPTVFSAHPVLTEIRVAIDGFGKTVLDHQRQSRELKIEIEQLDRVYRDVIGNLTETKGNLTDEHQKSLHQYSVGLYTVRSLKMTRERELLEIESLKNRLKKLNLALSWVVEDVNVLERRKKDGEENVCLAMEPKKKTTQTSRMLGADDDELRILLEELKIAEIQAFDAAEETKILQHKLEAKQQEMKMELESTIKVINKLKTNLAELNAKVETVEKEAEALKIEVDNLLKEKAQLIATISEQSDKFRTQVKTLKSFHAAVECYTSVRNSISNAIVISSPLIS